MDILDGSVLPIAKFKTEIIDAVRQHQVVIVQGNTGSGKTTQIPQYLLEAGINNGLTIGITQPRRIGVISVARRVSEEMKCELGKEVGYEIKADNQSDASTKIKFMTDGILLNHCISDSNLKEYGIIMIDEAHERSIHTDVLLGLLKIIIERRKNVKVIIASATMNSNKFASYFKMAKIISVEGRLHKVALIYESVSNNKYLDHSIKVVIRIHQGSEKGDILLFLTGQKDIEICCERLNKIANLVALPLYSYMDWDLQKRIFMAVGEEQRKVIVSTNIAETTITIDNVRFVIDSGLVKESIFDIKYEFSVLKEVKISKSQADQRKGRAGRTSKGFCYRLYEKKDYESFLGDSEPDIKLRDLAGIYLKIVAIGYDPMTFDFIDSPDQDILSGCKKKLEEFGLLDKANNLTDFGKSLKDLPVEPSVGVVLITSRSHNCTDAAIKIMSMMMARNVFKCSKKPNPVIESCHRAFFDEDGDHFSRLNVFNEFLKQEKSQSWCQSNFLHYDVLVQADHMRDQLIKRMKVCKIGPSLSDSEKKNIKYVIMRGFLNNICVRKSAGRYLRYRNGDEVFVHPSSVLFKKDHKFVVFHEILMTHKPYMHGIMRVDESFLNEFAKEVTNINGIPGSLFKKVSLNKLSETKEESTKLNTNKSEPFTKDNDSDDDDDDCEFDDDCDDDDDVSDDDDICDYDDDCDYDNTTEMEYEDEGSDSDDDDDDICDYNDDCDYDNTTEMEYQDEGSDSDDDDDENEENPDANEYDDDDMDYEDYDNDFGMDSDDTSDDDY